MRMVGVWVVFLFSTLVACSTNGPTQSASVSEIQAPAAPPLPNVVARPAPDLPVPDAIDVYLLPLDDFPVDVTAAFARYFTQDLGLRIKTALPTGTRTLLPATNGQYAGEDIIDLTSPVMANLPGTTPKTVYLVYTTRDINERTPKFRFYFVFNDVKRRTTVISAARMFAPPGTNPDQAAAMLSSRLGKMTKRAIGDQYYRLTRSSDIRDVMYSPIMSLDDLDRMGMIYLGLNKSQKPAPKKSTP